MLDHDVEILTAIGFWSSKVASFFDFFPGPCSLLDFLQSLVDLLRNGSEAVVVERDRVLFFCAQDA